MSAKANITPEQWLARMPPEAFSILSDQCLNEAEKVLAGMVRTMADDPRMTGRSGREALLILADALDQKTTKTETH